MRKYDVWVLPRIQFDTPGELKWEYVITVDGGDIGEIVDACKVLYPGMVGVIVEPIVGEDK